jgi:hypothetical protein
MIYEMELPEGTDTNERRIKLEKEAYTEEFLRFEALT